MLNTRPLALSLMLFVATGCANHLAGSGLKPKHADFEWDEVCYDGFAVDAIQLAGAAAEDCGILHLNKHYSGATPPAQCLQQMLAGKRPFRAALSSFGDDSRYCEAAIRNEEGQLFHIWLDFDVSGQWGNDGSNAVLSVSRCDHIRLAAGTIGPGSYFDLTGCEHDEALSAKMTGRGHSQSAASMTRAQCR